MKEDRLPPIGNLVGRMLDEGIRATGKSKAAVARDLGVPAARVSDVIAGRRGLTPEFALRLGRYFATSAEYWLGIQMQCELDQLRFERADEIDKEVQPAELQGVA